MQIFALIYIIDNIGNVKKNNGEFFGKFMLVQFGKGKSLGEILELLGEISKQTSGHPVQICSNFSIFKQQ